MSILSQTREYYKQLKAEEKQKKKLIKSKSDFHLLEQLIQKINENPDLRIEVRLNDGTVLLLKTYHKTETHDLINGNYEVIQ
jgi:hypothetical protein